MEDNQIQGAGNSGLETRRCFDRVFLSPAFAAHLFPHIMLPGLSELLLTLWLLVMSVNVQRWKEQAMLARNMCSLPPEQA
jgi:hypothetical protein